MEILTIDGTDTTPSVTMDKRKGVFEVSGRALPANAKEFFAPLVQWMEGYAVSSNASTELVVRLEYINTASSKMLLNVFYELQKVRNSRVSWYFQEDDEDMEEAGEELSELVTVQFDLIPY